MIRYFDQRKSYAFDGSTRPGVTLNSPHAWFGSRLLLIFRPGSLSPRFAHRSFRYRSLAALRSVPIAWWNASASAIALWFAAGGVPTSSNLRMLSDLLAAAGVSGHTFAMFSRRT